MNKRIALIDPNEIPITGMYGKGLEANQIIPLNQLETLPESQRNELLKFEEGDAVMLVGKEPFNYLRNWYHYGVRNENYADCAKLYRLSMTGGGFAKCLVKEPTEDEVIEFLSPKYTIPVHFNYQQKVLKTYDEAIRFLTWLESLPKDEYFGYDYEGSGMPLDKWYELSGVSICNSQYGGFLALTDLRENCTPEQYREILRRLGLWVLNRMDHIWTFNMQYEYQVSHRMLGIDAYDLCDASVVNILDGHHLKKYSLKWTAQRILKVNVWDQHFDRLSDLMEEMYFTITGKTKAEKQKVFKVTKNNFKNTEEWKKIIEMFPNYEAEFERLILKYWGSPFMNIPSDILGYYCNLDAFYTLQIYLQKKDEYSEEAWNVFLDNTRLGCRLHSTGLYINEDFRYKYKLECEKMMAWGITYTATARCRIKMKLLEGGAADITKYPPMCKLLLENDKFYSGDVMQILKNIFIEYSDESDSFETGVDEGLLLMNLGADFAEGFMDIVKEAMTETDFKGKINKSVYRKRKFMGVLAEKFTSWAGVDKIKVDKKPHQELEQYLYFQRAYNELKEVSRTQLNDINNIPLQIKAFGQDWGAKDYSDFVSENYFKCKSSVENDIIIQEFFDIYRSQVAWLAALGKSVNQLPGGKKYYLNLGLNTPEEGYSHFMSCWQNATENGIMENDPYPSKMYTEALRFWQKGLSAVDGVGPTAVCPVKEVWTSFKAGVGLQRNFWKDFCDSMLDFYEAPFQESDINSDFTFIRKFSLHYLFYKKYAKVLSTYIDGMFKANNKWVIEGPDRIPIREADPTEPGAVEKCFSKYEINTKSSKRWSSGWHTVISHTDFKDVVCPPPAWDPINNKWLYGESLNLLTYYDINYSVTRA